MTCYSSYACSLIVKAMVEFILDAATLGDRLWNVVVATSTCRLWPHGVEVYCHLGIHKEVLPLQ